MRIRTALLAGLAALAMGTGAMAEEWVDYSPAKEPWTVTQVKVAPGKLDDYLISLKKSWIASMEIAKKNGDVLDYHVLANTNTNANGATVVFLVKFKDWSETVPNKDRDMKTLEEVRKSFSKDSETKLMDDRTKYRSFLDEGTFADVTYPK